MIPGDTYSLWVVISEPEIVKSANGKTRSKARCRCQCGTEKLLDVYHLRTGATKSCGCMRGQFVTENKFKGLQYPRATANWRKLILPYVNACELCGIAFIKAQANLDHAHDCVHAERSACPDCIRGLVCTRCNQDVGVFDRWGYPQVCAWWEQRRPVKDFSWQFLFKGSSHG